MAVEIVYLSREESVRRLREIESYLLQQMALE